MYHLVLSQRSPQYLKASRAWHIRGCQTGRSVVLRKQIMHFSQSNVWMGPWHWFNLAWVGRARGFFIHLSCSYFLSHDLPSFLFGSWHGSLTSRARYYNAMVVMRMSLLFVHRQPRFPAAALLQLPESQSSALTHTPHCVAVHNMLVVTAGIDSLEENDGDRWRFYCKLPSCCTRLFFSLCPVKMRQAAGGCIGVGCKRSADAVKTAASRSAVGTSNFLGCCLFRTSRLSKRFSRQFEVRYS